MMMLTTIFPIILLAVFGLLFFVIFKVGKKYMTMKVTHWLLLVYLAVLLVATIFVGMIDENKMLPNPVEQTEKDQGISELHNKLRNGKIDVIDAAYLKNEVNVEDYQDQTLTIFSQVDYGPQVFVERKEKADSKIEAFVFSSGIAINGMDFTDLLEPYQLDFSDQTLTIRPIRQDINLSVASNGFPIRQFTGDKMFNHSYIGGGDQVVYLRIPNDLELKTGPSGNIHLEYMDR